MDVFWMSGVACQKISYKESLRNLMITMEYMPLKLNLNQAIIWSLILASDAACSFTWEATQLLAKFRSRIGRIGGHSTSMEAAR